MSNQIVISSGAKVRSLEGVLTGTAGIVNSVPLGGANGVATLDSNGKVPLSQLPASVVTYLGTWNAATNTPTLTNGTGDIGDLYICNVAGTVNFGAGPITFAVGDWVIYNGSQWQKSAGASGTVTSVAVTSTGNDAISITGSPITTAGTINIGFTGTSAQYVNGAGDLTTFPTLTGYVPYTGATTDVDLGVHVLNAQALHVKGTAGAGHLGLKHQSAAATGSANESLIYANVDGDLAWQNDNLYLTTLSTHANTANRVYTFPNLTGTMAMLEGTQTFSGSKTFSGGASFTLAGGVVGFSGGIAVDKGTAITKGSTPASFSPASTTMYSALGDNNVIFRDDLNTSKLQFQVDASYTYTYPNLSGTLALLEGTQTFSGAKTFSSVLTADSSLLLKNGVFAIASGYTNLAGNNLNNGLVIQFYGSGGTAITNNLNFNATTGYNYTFPSASGTIALTSNLSSYVPYTGATANVDLGVNTASANYFAAKGDGSTGAGQIQLKQGTAFSLPTGYSIIGGILNGFYLSTSISSTSRIAVFDLSSLTASTQRTYTMPDASGTLALTSQLTGGTVTSVTVGTGTTGTDVNANVTTPTTTPLITINIPFASATNTGKLSNTDWTTFNNKQNALTNPITGTGTSGYHSKFTGSTTLGNSMVSDDGTTLTSAGATRSNLYLRAASSSYYGQIAFTNGSNASFGGISYNNSSQYMQFETNTSEWMRLYANGNLRVFSTSTSDNGAKFQVEGETRLSGTLRVNGTDASISALDVQVDTNKRITLGAGYPTVPTGTYWSGLLYNGTEFRIESYLGGTGFQNIAIARSGGNVGIGCSPANKLEVAGTIRSTTQTDPTSGTGIELFYRGADSASYIQSYDRTNSAWKDIRMFGNTLIFGTSDTERMRITSGGAAIIGSTGALNYTSLGRLNVQASGSTEPALMIANSSTSFTSTLLGIGSGRTAASSSFNFIDCLTGNSSGDQFVTEQFKVRGDGVIYAMSAVIQILSDEKIKENVKDSLDGLNIINALRPVRFDYKKGFANDKKNELGFIAQEVEKVFPEALSEWNQNGETYKTLGPSSLIPVLVKAIQELKSEIDELKNK